MRYAVRAFTLSLLGVVLLAVGCTQPADKSSPNPPPTAVSQKSEIAIGAILPLTGDIASYGKNAQKGIQLALDEINAASSGNMHITVDFQDGKGDAKEAVTIMNKFCTINNYPVVIGEAASSVSLAMAPIANRNQVVQISPISSSPELTSKGGEYFFRVCPSDAFQASILAEWMRELGVQTVGILFINNSWGSSLKDQFTSDFQKRGGTVKTVESCVEGDRDFRTQLTKIISADCDAVYSPTHGKEGGIILRQLKELGYGKLIFGSDVWSSPELIATAGEAAEGVYLVKPAQNTGPAYDAFKRKYAEKYKEEPDVYAAYSYDIMMILQNAFADGKTKGADIREYLLHMPPYQGVTGTTQFDEHGDCNSKSFERQVIRQGKYIIADTKTASGA